MISPFFFRWFVMMLVVFARKMFCVSLGAQVMACSTSANKCLTDMFLFDGGYANFGPSARVFLMSPGNVLFVRFLLFVLYYKTFFVTINKVI